MHLPSGEQHPAQVVDVSGTGAALRIPVASDPALARGDVIELSVSLGDREPVRTPAEVVFSEQDGESHVRYGFHYTNLGNLYSQLDEQYARLFSRRGAPRATASLARRIPIRMTWKGFLIDTGILDISDGGLGVFLTNEEAVRFRGAQRVQARFQLDPRGETFEGTLDVVHRTAKPGLGGVLVGLRFDFEERDGFGRHADAIRAFAGSRNRRLAGGEGSWRSAG